MGDRAVKIVWPVRHGHPYLTGAELYDLLVPVQTEFLNRLAQQDGFAVEVVTEEEAALLGRYRLLPPTQRERLQTIASGAYGIAG